MQDLCAVKSAIEQCFHFFFTHVVSIMCPVTHTRPTLTNVCRLAQNSNTLPVQLEVFVPCRQAGKRSIITAIMINRFVVLFTERQKIVKEARLDDAFTSFLEI